MNKDELSDRIKNNNYKIEKQLGLKIKGNPNKTVKSKRQVINLNKSF
jgi:hypothetical protein